jgi:hypothetical protein
MNLSFPKGQRRILSLLLAMIGLPVAVVATAGCGANQISSAPIADAAQTTIETGGARVAFTGSVTTAKGEKSSFTGGGIESLKAERGSLRLDMSQLPRAATDPAGRKPSQLYLREIFDYPTVYFSSPLFKSELPKDKKWIRFDLRKLLRAQFGADFGQLPGPQGTDPSKTLQYLRAIGHVRKVGRERVRGVETTHYSGTQDLNKVPTLAPPKQQSQVKAAIERLIKSTGGKAELPVDVWIDKKGFVRRLRLTYSVEASPGQTTRIEQTIELYDFGVRVSVPLPPQSQVKDVTGSVSSELRKQSP